MDKTIPKPLGTNYKDNPTTLGDKIRNGRVELKLLQKDIAKLLKVIEESITNWENALALPHIKYYPVIIGFLGYNPFEIEVENLAGNIKRYRIAKGLSHKNMGKLLGVDASTIGSWERNKNIPRLQTLKNLLELIKDLEHSR